MLGRYRDGRVNEPCFTCRQPRRPIVALQRSGVPHKTDGHNFSYEYVHISACDTCDDGEILAFSHDCYQHYEDEPWDMSWTLRLSRPSLERLQAVLAGCPDPGDYQCGCQIHESLRHSKKGLPDGRADSLGVAITSDGIPKFVPADALT
jgi:hypothetical protein